MDAVEVFGIAAVVAMLIFYALESRGPHFVLLFAGACAAASTYAALIAAWPFAAVEAVWALVAVRRWRDQNRSVASESATRRSSRSSAVTTQRSGPPGTGVSKG